MLISIFVFNHFSQVGIKYLRRFLSTLKASLFQMCTHLLTSVLVSRNFSFAKIINPPDRCGISTALLLKPTQGCLGLVTINLLLYANRVG